MATQYDDIAPACRNSHSQAFQKNTLQTVTILNDSALPELIGVPAIASAILSWPLRARRELPPWSSVRSSKMP